MKNIKPIAMTVRFPPDIHEKLSVEADKAGMSINQLVAIKCGDSTLVELIREAVRRELNGAGRGAKKMNA